MEHRHLPDANRLSVLAASILLAYAVARFIDLPVRDLSLQLPGIFLQVQINIRTAVAILVAGLTATGADWLLRQHPLISGPGAPGAPSRLLPRTWRLTPEHWLLPALTAWVIGIPLFQFSLGLAWFIGFLIGGALLMLVLVAEYITIDPEDVRQPAASAGLTAVAFALYLILAIGLRYAGIRLFLLLPALASAAGLVSLRSLHLRLRGRWAYIQAGVIGLVCGQLAAGLHYLPLSPVAYGLVLIGPAYALTSLVASLGEGEPLRKSLLEPGLVLAFLLGTAIWIG